jgi:hypothetical protein
MDVLLLDGRLVTPDSLLVWTPYRSAQGDQVVCAGDHSNGLNGSHYDWMMEVYPCTPKELQEYYRWPDLREITEYINRVKA